jgi:hypothetical protein
LFPSLVVKKWRLEEGKKIFHPFQMRGKGNGGIENKKQNPHSPPTPPLPSKKKKKKKPRGLTGACCIASLA